MGEIVFKIAVTALVVIISLWFILWLWGQQVDLRQTWRNIVKRCSPVDRDIIATRDQKKIYQGGKEVGSITGKVTMGEESIVFEEVCDSEGLNITQPFKYERYTVKVAHIDEIVGVQIGNPVKTGVKRGMKCMILK